MASKKRTPRGRAPQRRNVARIPIVQQSAAQLAAVKKSEGPLRTMTPAEREYARWLKTLKERVGGAQIGAALAANHEVVRLYWSIGRDILAKQLELGWGTKVIDRLSRDLRRAFPKMKGFSPRNLKYMRAFAEAWPDARIVQQSAAQIPWFHNCVILDRVKDNVGRRFYVAETIRNGWSRDVLALQIERRLHSRQGRAVNSFSRTLPPMGSDLVAQTLKDPYVFDFLDLGDEAEEREIENAMIRHVRDTLLELGVGFAFVGRQIRLEVGGDEFFLDLLFYHLRLRCYVVVELKAGAFRPEHAGKLNFYLSSVDDLIRDKEKDGPTLGLLLCRSKNRLVAEYALRDIRKPIGVADLQLTRLLPRRLKSTLPTVQALEAELKDLPEKPGTKD